MTGERRTLTSAKGGEGFFVKFWGSLRFRENILSLTDMDKTLHHPSIYRTNVRYDCGLSLTNYASYVSGDVNVVTPVVY